MYVCQILVILLLTVWFAPILWLIVSMWLSVNCVWVCVRSFLQKFSKVVAIIIGCCLLVPALLLTLLTGICLFIFGLPVAISAFCYFSAKRARNEIIWHVDKKKLRLLNLLMA